jgi:hypothetical protein
MDWSLACAFTLVGGLVGYLIGLLIHRTVVDPGPGGGGETPPERAPPPGDDWRLWERELVRV